MSRLYSSVLSSILFGILFGILKQLKLISRHFPERF